MRYSSTIAMFSWMMEASSAILVFGAIIGEAFWSVSTKRRAEAIRRLLYWNK